MADYVTKAEFEQFTSAILTQFEWVNYHLKMLVWAQNGGKGPKPLPPGCSAPATTVSRTFGGRVVHITQDTA